MKQKILCVHGAFCGPWAFDQFRAPFEQDGFALDALTLPHHHPGADLEALAQTGLQAYADQVAAMVRACSSPPVLIAHSMGGLVAQMVATREDLAALILLAPSAPWGVMPMTMDEGATQIGLMALGDYWRRPCPPDFRVAYGSTLDRLPLEEAQALFQKFVPESGRALWETVQWWRDASMSSAAAARKIKAPVLALVGGRDRVNSAHTVRRIVARFPKGQAQIAEFPEMSHWILGEPGWREAADVALAWLNALGLKPPPASVRTPQITKGGWREGRGYEQRRATAS